MGVSVPRTPVSPQQREEHILLLHPCLSHPPPTPTEFLLLYGDRARDINHFGNTSGPPAPLPRRRGLRKQTGLVSSGPSGLVLGE